MSAAPEWLHRLGPPEPLLAEIERRALDLGLEAHSFDIGRLLEIVAGGPSVARVLEVGRGLGFSTVCLARGATTARVLSIDRAADHLGEVRGFLAQAEVEERVTLLTGEPLQLVEALEERFHLIHLAVPLADMLRLIDRVLPLLVVGGVLTAEGLLEPEGEESDRARAVGGYLVMHPQLQAQILPIGRGLGLARKMQPLVTEMGGPY